MSVPLREVVADGNENDSDYQPEYYIP